MGLKLWQVMLNLCLTVDVRSPLDRAVQYWSYHMGRVKRIWYVSPMRTAKVQARLHIRAVSPEPPLLAHTSSESRGTFRQKARSLAPLNGWACAVKICHDGMLEDTNSLDGAHILWVRAMNRNAFIADVALGVTVVAMIQEIIQAAPVAEWLRSLIFSALDRSSSPRCGFEPSSACEWSGGFSRGSPVITPPYDWLGSKWVK